MSAAAWGARRCTGLAASWCPIHGLHIARSDRREKSAPASARSPRSNLPAPRAELGARPMSTEGETVTESSDRDKCANPLCHHLRIVHRRGKCESLNTVDPCRCDAFVEPTTEELEL